MVAIHIEDEELVAIAEALAARHHTTIEAVVGDALRKHYRAEQEQVPQHGAPDFVEVGGNLLPYPKPEPKDKQRAQQDAARIVEEHRLPHDVAYRLATFTQRNGWTAEDLDAEIAWHKKVLANPDIEERKLPGWVDHIRRIIAWPDKDPSLTYESIEAIMEDMYDEHGLPR